MTLIETNHKPDGRFSDGWLEITCGWEYKLPSGKTGRCEATATWEYVWSSTMKQPFTTGYINTYIYTCDRHHTQKEEQ